MTNYHKHIEAYQGGNLKVLPLKGKSPVAKSWPTRDFAIEEFGDATAIGVQMGPTSGIIDFEYDSDAQHAKIYELFEGCEFLLDVCPAFKSKHGGHFLFKWDDALEETNAGNLYVPCDNEKLIVRIGAAGKGSQSAFPPSPGKTWLDGRSILEIDAPELPSEVIERLLTYKRPPTPEVTDDPETVATSVMVEECKDALSTFDEAVAGNNGHGITLKAACEIRRHRIYGEQGYDLLQWFNENKCIPTWDESELQHKWEEAKKFEPAKPNACDEFDIITGAEAPSTIKHPNAGIVYRRITSSQLATEDYKLDYAIADTMVEGQPLIIAGPQKVLKTSAMIDAAISLATAGFFLGKLRVNRPYRVAVMSGESGLGTLQETAKRICAAANVDLAKLDNLIWSPDLPKFGDGKHATALEKYIQADGLEMLFVDPAYLCIPGADAGNVMIMGELLREVSLLCERNGVTLVMAHHTKKINDRGGKNQPLSLTDIAWAGFQEFARQWWLLNRREPYEEGSGEHRLWLSIGGSAGHSALWGVDVNEGVRSEFCERTWDVEVFPSGAARSGDQERKAVGTLDNDKDAVLVALAAAGEALTKSKIRERAKIRTATRARAAIDALIAEGSIIEADARASNNQTYSGFALAERNQCD